LPRFRYAYKGKGELDRAIVNGRQRMSVFDVDSLIERLCKKQLLAESAVREVCEKVKELLMRESNVVHLSAPVTVVGDIHG